MNNYLLPIKQELLRKIIHLTSLSIPFSMFYLNYNTSKVFIFSLTILILLIDISRRQFLLPSRLFNILLFKVTRNYEHNNCLSATYMLLSFSVIVFSFDIYICIVAMIISIISDAAAAGIGIKYGKIYLVNGKTLEGFYAFIISAIIILYYFYTFDSLIILLFIALLGALTELFTPTRFDNFTLPIINSILLFILL